jgi:hypothetical protein
MLLYHKAKSVGTPKVSKNPFSFHYYSEAELHDNDEIRLSGVLLRFKTP